MALEDAAADVEDAPDDAPVDETETPSGDVDDADEGPADEEPADEPDDEDEGPPAPEGDPAVVNLEKKFAHIKDPEERRVAVAKAYWEKTNYASKTRRENERLKREIAARNEIDSRKEPAKPAEPPPPDPDLVELDQRIQALYTKDQEVVKEANGELEALNAVDVEIAKLTARFEDAKAVDDTAKADKFEMLLENKKLQKDSIIRRYKDLIDRRKSIGSDYERMNRDRIWLSKVIEDRATRQESQRQEEESFKAEFPEKVDNLIEAAATRLGIPDHLAEELLQEVNEGLLVDLWRLGEADLDDVNVPELVKARVEKFMKARDMASRRSFKERSSAKARVASAPGRPPSSSTPARSNKPVTPASLQAAELGPKMRKAREYLASKGY